MNSLSAHLATTLRLHFRERMGWLYGYLFPTIFTICFWVLYRYETVPLARHMGELLTITALSGCCFGLPASIVAERERSVWRRYRLAPVPTQSLLASTAFARYLLLLTAMLLQVGLAMGIGMPLPLQPLDLWIAFTFAAFAFIGIGLVIAMLADTVTAVQALGQCIFLPMLIIGGVGIPLGSLPAWAQHLSAFLPGRYAVEAIQGAANGNGIGRSGFALFALGLIGVAGLAAATKLFRWDAQQRFRAREGKRWAALALLAWVAVGGLAEVRGLMSRPGDASPAGRASLGTISDSRRSDLTTPAGVPPLHTGGADSASSGPSESGSADPDSPPGALATGADSLSDHDSTPIAPAPDLAVNARDSTSARDRAATPVSPPISAAGSAASWRSVTMADIERDVAFADVPPDEGVVAPVATVDDPLLPEWTVQLNCMRAALPEWGPARVADPVQRARNVLAVAAVADVLHLETERWVPLAAFERLEQDFPAEELIQLLYWAATHPDEGDISALGEVRSVCLDTDAPTNTDEVRERIAMYAIKLLGRLTGKLTQR